MNECRYHAVGSEVFYKGDKKVKCFGDESERMAKDIAEHLNEWIKTLEWLDTLEHKNKETSKG